MMTPHHALLKLEDDLFSSVRLAIQNQVESTRDLAMVMTLAERIVRVASESVRLDGILGKREPADHASTGSLTSSLKMPPGIQRPERGAT